MDVGQGTPRGEVGLPERAERDGWPPERPSRPEQHTRVVDPDLHAVPDDDREQPEEQSERTEGASYQGERPVASLTGPEYGRHGDAGDTDDQGNYIAADAADASLDEHPS